MPSKKSSKNKTKKTKARIKPKAVASKKKNTRKASRRPKSSATKNRKSTGGKPARRRTTRAGQAGDLQGISRRRIANSESVKELLEEGNAFEAGVVSGVQRAEDSDEQEVRTHEVPEDDVPEEYLDKDS